MPSSNVTPSVESGPVARVSLTKIGWPIARPTGSFAPARLAVAAPSSVATRPTGSAVAVAPGAACGEPAGGGFGAGFVCWGFCARAGRIQGDSNVAAPAISARKFRRFIPPPVAVTYSRCDSAAPSYFQLNAERPCPVPPTGAGTFRQPYAVKSATLGRRDSPFPFTKEQRRTARPRPSGTRAVLMSAGTPTKRPRPDTARNDALTGLTVRYLGLFPLP